MNRHLGIFDKSTDLVVVTGASGGIGRAIARVVGAEGYAVLLHYNGSAASAGLLAESMIKEGTEAATAQADLTTQAGVESLAAQVEAILSSNPRLRLRGLVNNAGLVLGPSFTEATPALFDKYIALNTRAPFFLTQRLALSMGRDSSVVNISSAAAHFSSPGDIVYAMSKSALESFTRNAAEALAPRGIRINTVIPGFTDNGHPALADPRVRDYVSSFALLGGIAQPTAVAEAVLFLLSSRTSRMTGASLDVTGGSTLGARTSGRKVSLREAVGGSDE